MKKVISTVSAVVVLVSMIGSAFAASDSSNSHVQQSHEKLKALAYMELDGTDAEMRTQILEAREEIILSQSWVADGLSGRIVEKDGSVVEELPQFSQLFPADWDVPTYPSQTVETDVNTIAPYLEVDNLFQGEVFLKAPSADRYSTPFYTFDTTGFKGTPYEYTYATINTYGFYNNPSETAYYNIGYANSKNGRSYGWVENLANGRGFEIDVPYDVSIAVRASTYRYPYPWYMNVVGVRK